jgi:PAS domain S-box-containing protein
MAEHQGERLQRKAERALLALSRELAAARDEGELTGAVARALEGLFPARCFALRLLDPTTGALSSLFAHGRLRRDRSRAVALRRIAIEKVGLDEAGLAARGVEVTEEDAPLFEGCVLANAIPLAVSGQLFGILNLEYPVEAAVERDHEAPLGKQVANHAALALRNLRSLEEATYLKNYLQDVIEHANAVVAVVNRCREVVVWNGAAAGVTGHAGEEVLGDDLFRIVPEADRSALEEVLLRGYGGEAVNGFETRFARKDGGEVRLALNTAPVRDADGVVEGVIAIGQDLTLVQSLRDAAEHAERLAGLGRLVAGVVHELNNPLTAVTMYSDALLEKLTLSGQDPADLEKLRAIRDAGNRIQRLARDLVAYARPAGARTEALDLALVVDDALRMAKPALTEANAAVVRRFDLVPEIDGNRASLTQVFVNLVTNAAQAVGAKGEGTIVVAIARAPGGVVATIEDSGEGLSAEARARALEPFFTTRPGRGIGLGLPIVEGIVARHGGAIALEPAPGGGTRVTVTLPVRGR